MNLEWRTQSFSEFTPGQLYEVMRLRSDIFVVEQASIYLDADNKDQVADHVIGSIDNEICAYLRALPPGVSYPQSSLGRILIAQKYRGHQLGRDLVKRGIAHNLSKWPDSDICISAQSHLQDFYASLGFAAEGEVYAEDGIPHRKMRLLANL